MATVCKTLFDLVHKWLQRTLVQLKKQMYAIYE